jgi:hypothetical protein
MRTGNRRARATVAVLAASLALVTVIGPVSAAAPQQVAIVSSVTFTPDGNLGDFDASGDAAEEGLICASGTFVDTGIHFAGYQSGRGIVQLQVFKEFDCGDGTFFVKMQIQANFDTGFETFTWVVQGGTGAYEHLRGSGRGHTVPRDGGNTNYYDGLLIG